MGDRAHDLLAAPAPPPGAPLRPTRRHPRSLPHHRLRPHLPPTTPTLILLGALRVACSAEMSGTVGPESEDRTKTLGLSGCTVVKGTCESPKVTASHLPWDTKMTSTKLTSAKLSGSSAEAEDAVEEGGSGSPGYTIMCGSKPIFEDECEFGKAGTALTNISAEGAVQIKFESKMIKASCNHGEKGSKSATGTIEGSIDVTEQAGEAIRIAPAVGVGITHIGGTAGGGAQSCAFTLLNQTCEISVENVGIETFEIRRQETVEFVGGVMSKGRYFKLRSPPMFECVSSGLVTRGTSLATGETCRAEVILGAEPPGGTALGGYEVRVRSAGGFAAGEVLGLTK